MMIERRKVSLTASFNKPAENIYSFMYSRSYKYNDLIQY